MHIEGMNLATRRKLVQMACVAAWSDMDVAESERGVVRALAHELGLGGDDLLTIEEWLKTPPPEFDPYEIPRAYREAFVDVLERVVVADGVIDPEECVTLALIRELSA